jgi:hypothetical protein
MLRDRGGCGALMGWIRVGMQEADGETAHAVGDLCRCREKAVRRPARQGAVTMAWDSFRDGSVDADVRALCHSFP